MNSGNEAWHRPLHHTQAEQLSDDTVQTSGMRRREGISQRLGGATKIWMGESLVAGGARSANHHHGESETAIYVLSGHPVFVFAEDGGERRVETGPGDYVFIPPFVPHREENPDPGSSATVVLARSTQEAIVVNLTDLHDPAGRPTLVRGNPDRLGP